jgi:hypothetical protein
LTNNNIPETSFGMMASKNGNSNDVKHLLEKKKKLMELLNYLSNHPKPQFVFHFFLNF